MRSKLLIGLGIVLMGTTAARADGITVQPRAQEEMNRGKDYSAAWAAASRAAASPSRYSDAEIAYAREARRAMNEGKDYYAAWDARPAPGSVYSPDEIAKAWRAQEKLRNGKDYATAWEAGGRVHPTRAPSVQLETTTAGRVQPGPTRAAGRDGTSTMK